MMYNAYQAREVRPNSMSSTGFYVTTKRNILPFESQLERDAFLFLDFESNVERITSQPLRIRDYFPDCEVITNAGNKIIVEIKYESELVEKWSDVFSRFSIENQYCITNGLQFGFITDAVIYRSQRYRLNILKRIKFLGMGDFDGQVQEQLANELLRRGPTPLSLLVSKIEAPIDEARKVREVCGLVCSGEANILTTQSAKLADCVLSIADSHTRPIGFAAIIGFERMKERIKTHPLRHMKDGWARIVS
jgi:TnsA-like endonuclease N terminal